MEFVIENASEWITALRRINRAADDSPRHLTDIHAHIRMCAFGNSLELLARDDVVAAVTSVSGPVTVDGSCCIPLRLLHAVLERAPAHPVSVRLRANGKLEFQAPRWRRTIAVREGSDIHNLPAISETLYCLPANAIRRLLAATVHAADTDPTRLNRGCVILKQTATHIEASASDSHRAAYARTPFNGQFESPLVIHQRALREIQQAVAAEDTDIVEIGKSRSHLFFKTPSTTVATRLIDVAMYDVSEMFGKHHASTCRVLQSELLSVLDSAFDTTGSEDVALRLSSNGLTVTAVTQRGSTSDEIAGKRSGPDAETEVTAKYLREAAVAVGGHEVVLEVGGLLEPLYVRPGEEDDAEVVVMPKQRRV